MAVTTLNSQTFWRYRVESLRPIERATPQIMGDIPQGYSIEELPYPWSRH